MPRQPIHAAIAEQIAARIAAGTYGGMAPLPSVDDLAGEFKVSRSSVLKAMDDLRKRGLVHTIHRRGTFVRPAVPRRLIPMDRYRGELTAALAGNRPDPTDPDLPRADVDTVDADADVARLFGVPAGTRLVRRYWLTRVGPVAAQMTTSYLPADTVPDRGAPLLRVGVGPVTYLVSVGVVPTGVREVLAARMPTAVERSTLETGDGWVIAVTRRLYAGDRVVEVAREIVISAQVVEFEAWVDLA